MSDDILVRCYCPQCKAGAHKNQELAVSYQRHAARERENEALKHEVCMLHRILLFAAGKLSMLPAYSQMHPERVLEEIKREALS